MKKKSWPHFNLTSLILTIMLASQVILVVNQSTVKATVLSIWPHPPLQLTFPNNNAATISSWNISQIVASVPSGVTDGSVTVETDFGVSNNAPFIVGSSSTPDETGEASSWTTTFSGNVSTDTIWSQDILLTGDVTVPSGVSLTIQPGVTVFFDRRVDDQTSGFWTDKTEIHVYGSIIAEGTETDPIYFTSNFIVKNPSDWGAIVIRKDGNLSLSNCVVHYAEYGIYFYTMGEGSGVLSGSIQNCNISDNTRGLVFLSRPDYPTGGVVTMNPVIVNNLIEHNTEYGIHSHTILGYGTANTHTVFQNNRIINNGNGVSIKSHTWWVGHVDDYVEIRNNIIKNNAIKGIYIEVYGSSDNSGSDTDEQPIIENNLLDNNDTHIHLLLNPYGSDGTQILSPTIRYNTFRNGDYGIVVDDTESFDTLSPTISHNIFYDITNYAINNTTTRQITATQNYWGNTETEWDAGAQLGDINGNVDTTNHLNSTSPPILTFIEPGTAQAGDQVILYGANFTLPKTVFLPIVLKPF